MANLGHYDAHPGYVCQATIIGKKIKTTQAGNMSTWEVEVSRGSEWFAGGELEPDDRGVNAAGIAFEMLCNGVTWMGAAESFLHQASFEAVRDNPTVSNAPLSPLITERVEGQAALARLFEYHDLFGRPHKDTWQFELGIWEHGDIDVDALPEVGSDDLTDEPELTGELWADTINQVRVRFSDRAHAFKEKLSDPASDPNNFRIVGEKRSVELDRTWCTDGDLSNHAASVYLGINAQPKIKGSIRVKREVVDDLELWPGKLIRLNVASDGRTYVMRLGDMDWPTEAKGDVGFEIENERGIWPRRYIPSAASQPGNFIVEPVEIKNERLVLLPSQLRSENSLQIAVLAQRPSDKIVGFAAWAGLDPDVLDLVAPHNNFAAYGKLRDANYAAAGPTLDNVTGIIVEILGVDPIASQTDAQRDDDNVLIFFGNEIGAMGQATPAGGNKYQVFLRRARYGSLQLNHLIGEDVWFIARDRIVPISNKNFQPGATCYFKLQPYTDKSEYDLALVDAITHVIGDGPFILAGLELAGQGNDPVFIGRDPKFAWRMYSVAGAEISGPELSLGAYDDQFAQFNLRVRDADTGAVVWTGASKVPEYVFDYEQNAQCAGGPRRTFHFEVAALARDGRQTSWLNFGAPFSNPQTVNPSGGTVGVDHNSFFGQFARNLDLDFAAYLIWRSLDPAFTVDSAIDWQVGVDHAGVMLVYDSPAPDFRIAQPEASTFYYKSAPYDTFGRDGMDPIGPTPPLSVTTETLTPTIPPPPIDAGSQSFTAPFDVSVSPPAGMKVVYVFDRESLRTSAEWPGGIGSYGVINISRSCALHWRGIDSNGVLTQEGVAIFTLVASGSGGTPTCAAVSLSVVSGTPGWTAINVALACAQSGSTIHYSKNGGALTTYTTSVTLALGDFIEFYADASGFSNSPTDYYENTDLTH